MTIPLLGGRIGATAAAAAVMLSVAAFLSSSTLAAADAQPTAAQAAALAGRWSATGIVNDAVIPFRFEITVNGADVKGTFVNGDDRVTSSHGTFKDGVLAFAFDQFASTLDATLKDGVIDGQYFRPTYKPVPIHATRYVPPPPVRDVPSIDGVWKVATPQSKTETAWRLIVKQSGPDVSAAMLRVDGDTGTLTGRFSEGKFVLSHFSGARPSVFEVTRSSDGTLAILQNNKTRLTAVRVDDPRAKDVPEPTDPASYTRMKDPTERLHYSFPDLAGKTVSDTDPQLQGKVVLVSVSGSWCANCRDEAPVLRSLYKKYRKRGFEIVALAFEEGDQLKNPARLRAFIKEYRIAYTVLLAGDPDQLTAKVPQADNLTSFPTSFLVGRDGKVRAVHSGFPSPASGKFFTEAEHELTAQVERLLAERPTGTQ
jgi:thiol-disulfide isomerase/thioredoxin